MKHDPEKTSERLHGVPYKDRVYIFNASIVIEFLNQTLMPTGYFISNTGENELAPGVEIERRHMKNPDDLEKEKFTVGDLYEFYKLYREQKDYTAQIESRYKFSVILKKLRYLKNGWQFKVKRVGRAQLVYLAPAQLRVRVPLEIRKLFPPGGMDLDKGMVEVKPEDFSDAEYKVDVRVSQATYKMKEEGEDNFTEVQTEYDDEEERWSEAVVYDSLDYPYPADPVEEDGELLYPDEKGDYTIRDQY